jgi:hypothetical protein
VRSSRWERGWWDNRGAVEPRSCAIFTGQGYCSAGPNPTPASGCSVSRTPVSARQSIGFAHPRPTVEIALFSFLGEGRKEAPFTSFVNLPPLPLRSGRISTGPSRVWSQYGRPCARGGAYVVRTGVGLPAPLRVWVACSAPPPHHPQPPSATTRQAEVEAVRDSEEVFVTRLMGCYSTLRANAALEGTRHVLPDVRSRRRWRDPEATSRSQGVGAV